VTPGNEFSNGELSQAQAFVCMLFCAGKDGVFRDTRISWMPSGRVLSLREEIWA